MQDVRQSLRVHLEQGAAKGLPTEGLSKEKAKAGGPYLKLSPWLQSGLGLGERQTQVLLWWEVAKERAEQQKDFSPKSFSTWAITWGLVLNLSQQRGLAFILYVLKCEIKKKD